MSECYGLCPWNAKGGLTIEHRDPGLEFCNPLVEPPRHEAFVEEFYTEVVQENWTVIYGVSQASEGMRKLRKAGTFQISLRPRWRWKRCVATVGGDRGPSGAAKAPETVQEIAAEHQLHPNQVSTWKRQAIDGLADGFSGGKQKGPTEAEVKELPARIGRLAVENDFLSEGLKR